MKLQLNFFYGCLLLLLFITGKQSVKNFEWLNGSWQMKKKSGAAIMENWHAVNDSTMAGESLLFSVVGQSSVSEKLTLVFRNNEYYYVSTVTGQNDNKAVTFRITSHSAAGFVAENPDHDFPKRISYNLINKDSIHAFIDGGAAMPDKRINFYYSRLK